LRLLTVLSSAPGRRGVLNGEGIIDDLSDAVRALQRVSESTVIEWCRAAFADALALPARLREPFASNAQCEIDAGGTLLRGTGWAGKGNEER
jgi:hypothetical protein